MRRLRGVRRRHLDVAPLAAEADPNAVVGYAVDDQPAADASPSSSKKSKEKRLSPTGAGALILGNLRLVLALVFFVLGVALVILGWYGAAHTNILTEQIPYFISGGLLGMALIIVAGVLGSSATLERESRELRDDVSRALDGSTLQRIPLGGTSLRPRSEDGQVYVVPGGRSYHVAGCPIVEGKDASELSLPDAAAAGFTTCKLCGD